MRYTKKMQALTVAAVVAVCGVTAFAEPLVKMEGGAAKPGVVTAWTSSGPKVELTVKAGTDAKAVAEAIEAGVDKVKAKVQGGKIVVLGKPEAELLPALAEVDFGADALGELAKASAESDEGEGGSSLRAKKTADLSKMFKDQATTTQGTVVSVGGAKFPDAEVTVNILRAPTGELGKAVRKGQKIKFKPLLKQKAGAPDWSDENTQLNAGAWYLQKGDKVVVKIGKVTGDTYEAEIISRQ